MSSSTPANPNATVVPGICLIVTAAITLVLLVFSILAGIVAVIEAGVHDDDVIAFVFLSVTFAMQLLILWGGINMVRRRGYVMAIVGVIVAIAPLSACWCLNLPLGAWALVTLTKSGTRAIFSPNQIL
jgi:DMSO/TMAO reductase YedYZ heme-binding membrane subunit